MFADAVATMGVIAHLLCQACTLTKDKCVCNFPEPSDPRLIGFSPDDADTLFDDEASNRAAVDSLLEADKREDAIPPAQDAASVTDLTGEDGATNNTDARTAATDSAQPQTPGPQAAAAAGDAAITTGSAATDGAPESKIDMLKKRLKTASSAAASAKKSTTTKVQGQVPTKTDSLQVSVVLNNLFITAIVLSGPSLFALRQKVFDNKAAIKEDKKSYIINGAEVGVDTFLLDKYEVELLMAFPSFFDLSGKWSIAKVFTSDQLKSLKNVGFMDASGWNWIIFPVTSHDEATPEKRDQIMRDMLWDLQQFIAHPDFVMPDRYPHPTRLHKLALVMEGVNISEDDDKVVRLLPTAKAVLADARREDISVTPTKLSGSFTLTKPKK
jgi:hypothetical protein